MKYKYITSVLLTSLVFANTSYGQTAMYSNGNNFNPPSNRAVHHYSNVNHNINTHYSNTNSNKSRVYGSEQSLKQTKNAEKGVFAPLERRSKKPIQIQESWNKAKAHSGVVVSSLCPACTYKVITREEMITTIVLPSDAVIKDAYIGDNQNFEFRQSDLNKVIVRPTDVGLDTNLSIVTANHVYMFYIRSESWNSKHRPNLLYVIKGKDNDKLTSFMTGSKKATSKEKSSHKKGYNPNPLNVSEIKDVNHFNIHGQNLIAHTWSDKKLKSSWKALKPDSILRDDKFTYLIYTKKQMKKLKDFTAYEVNAESKDENINRRRVGNMIILETLADKITLRQESNILCIDYKGEK